MATQTDINKAKSDNLLDTLQHVINDLRNFESWGNLDINALRRAETELENLLTIKRRT